MADAAEHALAAEAINEANSISERTGVSLDRGDITSKGGSSAGGKRGGKAATAVKRRDGDDNTEVILDCLSSILIAVAGFVTGREGGVGKQTCLLRPVELEVYVTSHVPVCKIATKVATP